MNDLLERRKGGREGGGEGIGCLLQAPPDLVPPGDPPGSVLVLPRSVVIVVIVVRIVYKGVWGLWCNIAVVNIGEEERRKIRRGSWYRLPVLCSSGATRSHTWPGPCPAKVDGDSGSCRVWG